MKDRDSFKSQIVFAQNPKRRIKTRKSQSMAASHEPLSRYVVNIMELHRNATLPKRRRKPVKSARLKGILLALTVTLGFFSMGYLIAALSLPIWAKTLLFVITSASGLIPSYFLATFFQ